MKLNLLLWVGLFCLCLACNKTDNLSSEVQLATATDCADQASPRIENSKDGALLFDPSGKPNTFNQEDLKIDVQRYWGDTEAKAFSIPFAKAKKLLLTSPEQALSLALSDLETPALVEADWLPQSTKNIAKADACTAYFNLDKALITSFEKAIIELNITLEKQTIHAHIGRGDDGVSGVYFVLGAVELHLTNTNNRGISTTCGAKIPPGS